MLLNLDQTVDSTENPLNWTLIQSSQRNWINAQLNCHWPSWNDWFKPIFLASFRKVFWNSQYTQTNDLSKWHGFPLRYPIIWYIWILNFILYLLGLMSALCTTDIVYGVQKFKEKNYQRSVWFCSFHYLQHIC